MILLLLIVLGLVLGSFVNAFVWRLHTHRDWVNDRSECTHCHHKLAPVDLIPVVSWVMLRGKCRYCHKKIDDNPLVELTLPLLFVVSYLYWPVPFNTQGRFEFLLWLIFLTGFLALAVYDLRWFLLPDKIIFPLVGLALIQVITITVWHKDWAVAASAFGGVLAVSGTFYVIFQMSRGNWIGGGDVKLGLVLGLLAGNVIPGFLVLFVASALGVLVALPMLLRGKANRKTQLPFGPLLIAGLIVVKLFGAAMINWYTGLFYA
ncbi:MAG TPA: prepilin peptidase [Candidatus Saccharimonadales bacterium]